MKIEAIGYKKSFMGIRMIHWKVDLNEKEYLIVYHGTGAPMDMIWDGTEFKNSDLTPEELDVIKIKTSLKPKPQNELDGSDDWADIKCFFKTGALVEAEPEYVRVDGIWSSDEVNHLLSKLLYSLDLEFETEIVITEEHIKQYDILRGLLGYTVTLCVDGDHVNDGQMVEYDFEFTGPNNEKFNIVTDMCLMVGFNYRDALNLSSI